MAVALEAASGAALSEHRGGSSRRWYRIQSLVLGLTILGTILLMAICAPLLSKFDPNNQDLLHTLQGPGQGHLLGTDENGRDVWSRILYGARISLAVAISVHCGTHRECSLQVRRPSALHNLFQSVYDGRVVLFIQIGTQDTDRLGWWDRLAAEMAA